MKSKILNKVIASLIIIILTVSDWGLLAKSAYAAYEELETQKSQTNNKNVEFDAYFKAEGNVHSISTTKDEEGKMYVKLNVKNGYLKQGTISFDNPNFIVSEDVLHLEQISGEKEIEIPFSFERQEQINLDYFGRESKVNLTATYIDENGKEKEISGTIKIHLNWNENATAKVEQQIEKVIDLGSGRTLVQVSVKDYIQDNSVPAEKTTLNVETLKIANTEIENVDVYAVNTTEANGIENGTGFSKENWEYKAEESKISINVDNIKTEDNKISWKNGVDEFKIIYILKSSNSIANKTVKLSTKGEIKYNDKTIAFEEEKDANLTMSGTLINSEILEEENLNKGYIYANSDETIFNSKISTEISYNDIIEYLKITTNKDSFAYADGNLLNTNAIVYKSTKISKANFDSIFGEGKIEIYSNGEKQAEINKDSEVNTEGNIVINYAEGINNIEIVTSKPIAEGKLEINNTKAIKAQTGYDVETIKGFKEIVTKAEVETNISKEEKEGRIGLNETVSKAELVMVTDNLSTVVKNENVEMRVLFRTDSNMYDLYKNPVIEIELPSQIKEVNLKSIEAAFGEGFSLRGYEIVETEEGKKVIRISLEGEQTKYAIDISEGMSIIVKTDMTLDKKSGSSEETVKLRYSNEKAIGYDNGGEAEGKVRIEAPTGVVAINSIEGYNAEGETATSLSSKEQVGELEILTDKKEATMTIDVINNYEKDIENPSILGRIPYEGNKKETGEELGSTFTAGIVRGIEKTEGIEEGNYKVYYSSNGEATAELGKAENGWTENIEEAGEVKSYLIEAEGYTMKQGEAMSFTYGIEIPEGLNHNESAYGTYAVNYEVEEAGELREEKIVAPTVGATTGAGPELEVSLEANVANEAEVEEGQIIKYSVKVKNVGSVEAKNVKVVGAIPSRSLYVKKVTAEDAYSMNDMYDEFSGIKEYTETVPTIAAGSTYTATYEVKAGTYEEKYEDIEPDNKIEAKAKISADDLGKELETNAYNNTIVKETIQLELTATFGSNIILKENDQIRFSGRVVNNTDADKENVTVTYNIPNGLNIEALKLTKASEDLSDKISTNNNVVTFNVGNVKADSSALIVITARVAKFNDNEYERTMVSKLETNGKSSNEIVNYAAAPKISAEQTSNKDKYIGVNTQVEYYIEIANSGKVQARNVNIKDVLPEELKLRDIKVVIGNEEEQLYSTKEIKINIPAETTAKITVIAQVSDTAENDKQVTNKVEISGDNIKTFEVNAVTHTITSSKEIITDNGEKINTYSITGTAWEDSNKDGKKDSGEPRLSNIEVILIDNTTGNIATKESSKDEQRTTTNSNGEYKFDEVKAGNYMVVFVYDSSKYNLTQYKKDGILDSENSDAVKTEIKLGGENKIAGVTEAFAVNSSSVSGIDIGLIKMDTAVFGIDKVVTKIVMQNTKTSKTSNFNDSKLAKTDVDAKYINATNLVMEYKITVKNEGSVEGYVKKIVDYVPSEFKFSTDSNKDWYLGSNGEVYNTSLANTLLKPGESKEVTLVLTKKMNENGDGIVHNTAEIAEVYNEYGAQNVINNDITRSAADVMIGIKLGKEITYISLIFVIFAFMGTGIYFINNKVFNKVIDKKLKDLDDDDEI